jgi:glycogen synthase
MTATRRFSVVINTDNRADSLEKTIESLRHLDHPSFEVVVVHGPTPDRTAELLDHYRGRIKVGRCEHRNLSESRNLGVALSGGEIVAFIDDDAYPDPQWLNVLDRAYEDPEVVGAGGPVWDWTGTRLQVLYSIAHQLGDVWVENRPGFDFSYVLARPGTPLFTYPIGTNASFRRDRIIEIGGFDEQFDYGWDDVDLCRRLIDRGWVVRVLEDGFVHHKSLPSEIRGENRALHNLRKLLTNKAYYAYKHGWGVVPLAEMAWNLSAYAANYRREIRESIARGLLDPTELDRYEEDVTVGFDLGHGAWLEGTDRRRTVEWFGEREEPFLAFDTLRPRTEKLHLCFVSAEYPPGPVDGIGRVVHELASGLGHIGHEVHVLTLGKNLDRIDLEDDVWVHRMVPRPHVRPEGVNVAPAIWDYAATMCDEALRIHAQRPLDLFQAPNWDSQGVAMLLDGRVPVVVGLYTPLATVVRVDSPLAHGLAKGDHHVAGLIELERLAYRKAPHFLACGPAIVQEIEDAYGVSLDRSRYGIVAHGVSDRAGSVEPPTSPDRINVLFVGRLEDRKGIDTLLAAIPRVVAACPTVEFTIAGEDSRPMTDGRTHRQRFESSAAWPAVADNVRFLGRVDDDERDRLYAACDVFVAPSRFESFGLILIDAMMFGKPAVACDVGGMGEIVEAGETGLLVPVGDAGALAEAITTLVTSPDLRRRLGAASRTRYERVYRADAMVAAVNRYYDSILGRHSAEWSGAQPDGPKTPPAPSRSIATTASALVRTSEPPGWAESTPSDWSLRGYRAGLATRLRCPRCRGPLEVVAHTLTASGEVKTGQVVCATDGAVGGIDHFKVDFVSPAARAGRPVRPLVIPDLGEMRVRADDPRVAREGQWDLGAGGLLASTGSLGDALVLEADCTDVIVRMWRQPAGGVADVFVDGVPTVSIDLFQPEGSQMLAVPIVTDLPLARRHLAVRTGGRGHPGSAGHGVCVEEFVVFGPRDGGSEFAAPEPVNRGNPYSVALDRWLATVAPGEPVLEVGGGDRRRNRPGHLNLEFLKFELADLYGDIHALPFADDTFAATWSQAVFEHVADPASAAAELIRVTRPGGLILTEVAFMQPLHAVPFHFFNMTTWGVSQLFASCEVLECDWFGELSGTVEWLVNAVGLPEKVDPVELSEVLARFRSYDSLVSHDELRPVASVVYLVARKPG